MRFLSQVLWRKVRPERDTNRLLVNTLFKVNTSKSDNIKEQDKVNYAVSEKENGVKVRQFNEDGGLYWDVLACSGLFWTKLGSIGLYRAVLDSTGLC